MSISQNIHGVSRETYDSIHLTEKMATLSDGRLIKWKVIKGDGFDLAFHEPNEGENDG